MNSIVTAKIIASKTEFAGRKWFYEFRELPEYFTPKRCEEMSHSMSTRYAKLTKNWDADKNSEWLCRIYLSSKMIMTATLQLNALEFAKQNNMRLVSPYLAYYSLLSLARGLAYTIPEIEWKNGGIIEIGHTDAINQAFNYMASFDAGIAKTFKDATLRQKTFRELISYKAPSSGDANTHEMAELQNLAILLAELAQFNSELLEASILKNAPEESFVFQTNYIEQLSTPELNGIHITDREDLYRLDYLSRKYPLPPTIRHAMTEGHVEDFFGAWYPQEDIKPTDFNPDLNWQLIFDIP